MTNISYIDLDIVNVRTDSILNSFILIFITRPYRDIRAFMRDEMDPPVYCSDRRLVKAAAMLRMIAATHGKTSVTLLDCSLLQHVLWYHPGDQRALKEWIFKRIVPETGMISTTCKQRQLF